MNDDNKFELSRLQYYLTIAALIVTIISGVASIGYTIRRIDELSNRVETIEAKGSTPAQLIAKDVQWISDNMQSMTDQMNRIENKLDRHMNDK
jgi:outer membrane murein-binding lipoprotein Lpp